MTTKELYRIFRLSGKVATDSRRVSGGELFFALKGDNFDGNDYAVQALEKGASYAVVDRKSHAGLQEKAEKAGLAGERLIPVDDTLVALQDLARWHRSSMFVGGKPLTVLALTGTNGKTTTKELIRTVLSVKYKVTATEGNLNNSIGVPLTLLTITDDTEIAIVEMGASHPGDIRELVSICLPNYGLITNVGRAHLLGFGSFEGVMKTKGELYDYIQRTADTVFINNDNEYLRRMADERPDLIRIPYGLHFQGGRVLPATARDPYLRIELPQENIVVNTRLIGGYNADNVMAALAVGSHFGISHRDAADAISKYVPTNNRSQMVDTGRNVLIVDAYNANPSSMSAALDNFAGIVADRKMLMLGDMLELGADSVSEHKAVVERALSLNPLCVWFVGDEFGKALGRPDTEDSDQVRWFRTSSELASSLAAGSPEGCTILVKGSRGMKMEEVVKSL